jgi:hypothetical protein
MDLVSITALLVAAQPYVELIIFLLMGRKVIDGSAKGAIAVVSETMSKGITLTDEQALQQASDLMGQAWPFIPEMIRKWIIQKVFDSMKLKSDQVVKTLSAK